jgi:hypothetical protein
MVPWYVNCWSFLASVEFFQQNDITAVSADDLHLSEHEIINLTGKYGIK